MTVRYRTYRNLPKTQAACSTLPSKDISFSIDTFLTVIYYTLWG